MCGVDETDLKHRLSLIDERLAEIGHRKKAIAVAAASGNKKARAQYDQLTTDWTALTAERELVSLALEALAEAQESEQRKQADARSSDLARQRKLRIDQREAELRREIESVVRRFEREGDPLQRAIWSRQLARARDIAEQEVG
jgi:hypothetical protein